MPNRVTTTTNTLLLPKVVDTILNSNVLATRVLTSAKKWSGEKIRKAIKYSKNTNGGSFDGFDTFATSAIDNRVNLEFEAKFYEKGVTLPFTELSKNMADPNRLADLAALELASAAEDMADDIGTLFYGDGTGNGNKDFLGLEAIVDDGTKAATYGGQLRATYTTLKSTVAASGGTLTLAKMATLYNAITSGSVKPTLGLTTETIFSLYEQLLQPQERINKDVPMMRGGLTGGTGFTALFYKGFPIVADEKCTSGVLYFVNEDFLEWRALPMAKTVPVNYSVTDIEGNDYTNVKGLGFSWSDWIIPSNQASVIGHMYLGGELWSSNPKRHGKLTSITGV
jgi:hypothetical protein